MEGKNWGCFGKLLSWKKSREYRSKVVAETNDMNMAGDAMKTKKKVLKVLAISGSLREASCTRGLLRAAQKHAENDPTLRMVIEIVTAEEIRSLPRMDPDLVVKNKETGNGNNYYEYPPAVESFIKKVKAADCILFSCPEYNYSLTGALKDALDWGCMSPDNFWEGKAGAIMAVGGSDARGCRCTYHIRQIGVKLKLNFVNTELFALHSSSSEDKIFNEETGDIIDHPENKKHPATKIYNRVKTVLIALGDFADKFPVDHSSD